MKSHYKSTQLLIKELQTEWSNHNIPKEIQNIYLDAFENLSKPQLHQFLTQEILSYESESSLILLCLNSILAQNESINSIKTLNQTLVNTKNWTMIEEVIIECSEIFEAYRNLTIDLVENILSWKNQMRKELHSYDVDLFYAGRSYVELFRNLLDFLLDSQFSRVFYFVPNDPFLVKCSRVMNTSQNFFIFKNQYFLTLTAEVYERIARIEESLSKWQKAQNLKLVNSITVKKNEEREESKSLKIARSSSNQRTVFKEKINPRESSLRVLKKPKNEFHYIDQLPDNQLESVDESNVESEASVVMSREKKARRHRINQFQDPEELSEISESLTSKYKKNQISSKKLPPLVNPRLKQSSVLYSETNTPNRELKIHFSEDKINRTHSKIQKNELIQAPSSTRQQFLKPNFNKADEQETKNFMDLERMVENTQMAEDILSALIKFEIKKTDLYSLAHEELNKAVKEDKVAKKEERNTKVAEAICESLVEFYLRCCNLEGLVEEIVYTCIENSRKVTKIAQNMELSDHIFNYVLTSFIFSISFEEIVEECITSSLEVHQKAIKSLTKMQSTTEKQLKPFCDSLIDEFLSNFLSSLIQTVKKELHSDQSFESLTSSRILSEKFSDFVLDKAKIQVVLYSEARLSSFSSQTLETSQEMVEIGSRPIIIAALLQKHSDFFSATHKNRLQADLIDLLQIYSALPDSDRPLISNKFTSSFRIPHPAVQSASSPSFLIRNIALSASDSSTCFTLQSTDPLYSLFFISSTNLLLELHSELAFQKSDLFSKVESILNYDHSQTSNANVLIPFFSKHLTWKVSWLAGLQLSESSQVSGCIESLYVHFSCKTLENETIPLQCKTLDPPFIFGLIHNPLYSNLKIPMAVCLVNPQDVIRN